MVKRSESTKPDSSWIRQNEISIAMSLITGIVPNLFDIVSLLEDHHPRYEHSQESQFKKPAKRFEFWHHQPINCFDLI